MNESNGEKEIKKKKGKMDIIKKAYVATKWQHNPEFEQDLKVQKYAY